MKIQPMLALLLSCLSAAATWAHDLPANRVTLVLRDETHLSLTCFIDYAQALHRTLAPEQALQDFVLLYSAMKPADFRAAAAQAHAKWSLDTRLTLPTGQALAARNWQWPEPGRAQALLQARAMHLLTGGRSDQDHGHETADEIRAEATSASKMETISVQLPTAFGKVLLVSYQPRQVWIDSRSAPMSVRF